MYHALALQIEISEINSVLMSIKGHIEHTLCIQKCLNRVLHNFYKLNFIWIAILYKWYLHLMEHEGQFINHFGVISHVHAFQ